VSINLTKWIGQKLTNFSVFKVAHASTTRTLERFHFALARSMLREGSWVYPTSAR